MHDGLELMPPIPDVASVDLRHRTSSNQTAGIIPGRTATFVFATQCQEPKPHNHFLMLEMGINFFPLSLVLEIYRGSQAADSRRTVWVTGIGH